MSNEFDDKHREVVARTFRDLGDDAYRQSGTLQRIEVDATYLRRGIEPDEAIAIEQNLTADGVQIVDDTVIPVTTFVDPPSAAGTGIVQLMGWARRYPLLSESEERALGYAIQDSLRMPNTETASPSPIAQRVLERAEQAKTTLVNSNIRLVAKMAFDWRFRYRLDPEDLVQMGVLGLIRACDKYDPDWGTRFATYAGWWIRQSISRGIDNKGSTIRLPVYMRTKISTFRRAKRSLGLSFEYHARDIPRISEALGWDEADTGRIAELSEQKVISYDIPVGEGGSSTLGEMLRDDSPTPEEVLIANDLADVLGELVDNLGNARLADVIRRRFGIGRPAETLAQIGDEYGLTRERIRQLEANALQKLKRRARKLGLHKVFGRK